MNAPPTPPSPLPPSPRPSAPRRRRGLRRWRRPRAWALAGALAVAPACSGVNVFALQDDVSLGQQAYTEILKDEQVLTSGPEVDMCRRVTDRLVAAADVIDPEVASAFQGNWEVEVIKKDDVVNAFCLPGGKMAVYTGILPVAKDDAGLAVVMAHEIAHATHRHGTQALTRQLGVQVVIELAAGEGTAELWSQATNLLIGLPMSRKAELQADATGLAYMAQAGYDPHRAVSFWEEMASLGGSKPPELLSTHPSDARRIAQIQELLPDAMKIYERATGAAPAPSP